MALHPAAPRPCFDLPTGANPRAYPAPRASCGSRAAALQPRPADGHVCVTGRNVPPELLAAADFMTQSQVVRHPLKAGFKAQRGIDL